jgi:hypothetical protein
MRCWIFSRRAAFRHFPMLPKFLQLGTHEKRKSTNHGFPRRRSPTGIRFKRWGAKLKRRCSQPLRPRIRKAFSNIAISRPLRLAIVRLESGLLQCFRSSPLSSFQCL